MINLKKKLYTMYTSLKTEI